jgi:hypothetical protein
MEESSTVPQHLKQLDPTEIIAIPYDIARLELYVAVVFGASIVAGGDLQRARKIAKYAVLLFVWFMVSGASPYINRLHTLWAAIYLSTLLWFDPPIYVRSPSSCVRHNLPLLDHMQVRLVRPANAPNPQALLASITTQSTIACAIPAQILLLYDRGWQVQRWPVPLVLGSTAGWCLGLVVGTIMASDLYRQQSSNKKQEDSG